MFGDITKRNSLVDEALFRLLYIKQLFDICNRYCGYYNIKETRDTCFFGRGNGYKREGWSYSRFQPTSSTATVTWTVDCTLLAWVLVESRQEWRLTGEGLSSLELLVFDWKQGKKQESFIWWKSSECRAQCGKRNYILEQLTSKLVNSFAELGWWIFRKVWCKFLVAIVV